MALRFRCSGHSQPPVSAATATGRRHSAGPLTDIPLWEPPTIFRVDSSSDKKISASYSNKSGAVAQLFLHGGKQFVRCHHGRHSQDTMQIRKGGVNKHLAALAQFDVLLRQSLHADVSLPIPRLSEVATGESPEP